ncbi:uncharacterized protein N0V89_003686 [Didymosphaeria variabile]|uniref:Transcription factor domain-containing protein n=1 Tax=Didymosphaeria variabile TaxID=1932322 RepID=A0A9W8XPS2_9PLEO|nr:uncharacterized protein N0V89_003686 [Didymosphaeria variabile]KAJ4355666.1 hypothetical protein N0V89_003686 [Didymosphaeria variabile]
MIHAAKDPKASTLSREFEDEAELLWRVERRADTLPALAGINFLFLSTGSHGKDKIAQQCINDVADMSRRMKLFDVPDRLTAADIACDPEIAQIATAQTAWASYNHLCMQSVFYLKAPIETPPAIPIPVCSPNEEAQMRIDRTFPAFSAFWVIASEIIFIYRQETERHPPAAFAYAKYRKLLSWANHLSGFMVRGVHNEAHVLVFHMFLHVIILDIFRPFVQEEKQHDFQKWHQYVMSPNAIFAASLKQLKSLVLALKAQSPLTVTWHSALLYVANASLKNTSDPEWRFYFMACIDSYQQIYRSYPVVSMVVQSLLMLAVRQKALTGAEARDVMRKGPQTYQGAMGGWFVVDPDMALKGSEDANADVITREFDDLMLFDEFTEDVV